MVVLSCCFTFFPTFWIYVLFGNVNQCMRLQKRTFRGTNKAFSLCLNFHHYYHWPFLKVAIFYSMSTCKIASELALDDKFFHFWHECQFLSELDTNNVTPYVASVHSWWWRSVELHTSTYEKEAQFPSSVTSFIGYSKYITRLNQKR